MRKNLLLNFTVFFTMITYGQELKKYELIDSLLKTNLTIEKYDSIYELINSIENVNLTYKNESLLYIITRGNFKKKTNDKSGELTLYEIDTTKINYTKKFISVLLDKGFNRNTKRNMYNSPILFHIEEPSLFEFLCQNGFDPNERLTKSFIGFPYFTLHSRFSYEIYEIAKKYGFDKEYKIPWENSYLNTFHLIISNSIDFDNNDFNKLCFEFKSQINVPEPESGLTPIMKLIIISDLNQNTYDYLKILLENGADQNILAQNTNDFFDQKHIEKGMNIEDLLKYYIPYNTTSNYWKEKTLELLYKYKDNH